jgi:GYF domain 2/LITAF-like zinc ribbon domain
MRWYVTTNGETVGPIEGEVLAAWAREGRLVPGTHVRDEAASVWVPVEQSPFAARPFAVQAAPLVGVWTCRYCGAHGSGVHIKSVSTGGWIVFVVLLVLCFVLCWVPLVTMKDQKTKCVRCGTLA